MEKEVKRGYWFYDRILNKPVQAKEDDEPDIVAHRRYVPLPVTRELLLRFGFKESREPGLTVYEKNGFRLYRKTGSDDYQLMHFGELGEKIEFMHLLQKKYREEVE